MKKIIVTLLLVHTFVALQAQKLESKIPNNADIVIAANAENLFKLINVSDIDNSMLGKEMLKSINRRRDDKVTSVGETGVNIKSNAYYFFQKTDSISYHSFLVELNDRKQYESMLKERSVKKIQKEDGYSFIRGSREVMIWNDNLLLIVNAQKSYSYFKKHKERFEALKEEGESMYSVKKRFSKLWTLKKAFSILENNGLFSSIATNSSFQKSKKKGASATLWVRNYGMLMSDIIGSLGSSVYGAMPYLNLQKGNNIYGIEGVAANLFFNESSASISLDMFISDGMKKSFKKIYNKKMNSTLINSFDHNKALAFWSVSMNTEELLLEYPEMMDKMYGGMLPKFKDEIDIVGDLLSLVLDEKAIAELFTGDALFVLNDFAEKDVTYTTYKYDKDYKSKEVVKTRKALVPDFTLMIGSEKKELLNKMFRLGKKHKVVSEFNGVFEFDKKLGKLPFDLYAVVKNDVLYMTTLKTRAISIGAGRGVYKSTKYSKLIKKNSSVLYTDVNRLIENLPTDLFERDERKMSAFSKENIKDAYFKVSKVKGNKMSSELRLNTKGKNGNALKMLFEFIDHMAK